jgi:hypothetical protein
MNYYAGLLRCRDIRTQFHNDWFRHSKVGRKAVHTDRQQGNIISLYV